MDLGKVDPPREGKSLLVDMSATDHHEFLSPGSRGHLQGLVQRTHPGGPLGAPALARGEHQVDTTRQGAAYGLPGEASHQHGLAHGDALEMGEVGGKMPGHAPVGTDDAVVGDGGHEGDMGSRSAGLHAPIIDERPE